MSLLNYTLSCLNQGCLQIIGPEATDLQLRP